MKLTDYHIIIEMKDEKDRCILINTLNGHMNVIDRFEKACIEGWKENQKVIPKNKFEEKLCSELIEANYMFDNDGEELELVRKTMELAKKRHEIKAKNIQEAVFVLTYQCNFACPYCYEADSSNATDTFMTRDKVDQVFNLHQNHLEKIAFYGGEPFLLRNRDIINYIIAKAPDATYSATTNGYFLEEYFDVMKSVNISHIMVTLDGSRDIHNKTRILKNGKGTFDKIFRGISLYLENSIPIKIRMNISNNNLDDCLALRSELINAYSEQYDLGILLFELQPVFQLPFEEKINIREKIYFPEIRGGKFEPLRPRYNMMTNTTSYPLRVFLQNMESILKPKYTHCDAESNRRFYDSDGNVYSCILGLGDPLAAIGIYYPELALKPNSMIDRSIESIEECSQCKLRFLCGGGCALDIMDVAGDMNKPNCKSIRHDIFVELPRLFEKYAG